MTTIHADVSVPPPLEIQKGMYFVIMLKLHKLDNCIDTTIVREALH